MTDAQIDALRRLPKVDRLAASLGPPEVASAAARQVIEEARRAILAGHVPSPWPDWTALGQARGDRLAHGRLVPVINATGVVIHTNLGRAPWPRAARDAAARASRYCDLEMDRDTGERGGRLSGLVAQLAELTGAADALVVNNCAAAVLLAVTALARDREVIVSRGELVEIGGSFRVPDVIASGGARLVEVGTTNRTRISDYAAGIGPDTAVMLRVHPSNFRVVGFTETPDRIGLVAVGAEHGVPVVEDLGSGSLDGARGETAVREAVAAGVDLVAFSGDKLLGGPQAGIVVGRTEAVARLRSDPLYRALRVDKTILAALEATLGEHLMGAVPPVRGMIDATAEALRGRADDLAARLIPRGVVCEVVADVGFVGGGALPGQELPGWVVRIPTTDPHRMTRTLRMGTPSVVARIHRGALHLDLRTVALDEVDALWARVAEVASTQ